MYIESSLAYAIDHIKNLQYFQSIIKYLVIISLSVTPPPFSLSSQFIWIRILSMNQKIRTLSVDWHLFKICFYTWFFYFVVGFPIYFLKNHELFAMLISPVLSLHLIMTFNIFLSLWFWYFGKTVTQVVSCAFIRSYIILF